MNLNQRNFSNFIFYMFLVSVIFVSLTETEKSFAIVESYCVDYHRLDRIITINCGIVHLSDIESILSARSVLTQESVKNWHLQADIVIENDATLIIDSTDTTYLKIENPYGIKSLGTLIIDSVKISSWDSKKLDFATTDGNQPRSYITHWERASGQMNITNSEISHLGYYKSHKQGISYYSGDGSVFNNNHIHDLWYGFYSNNVGFITIENNVIHDNEIYGIDPHTGSHDIIIRNNTVYNIREGLGIVCSFDCTNILIEKNTVSTSKKAGIMLSRNVEGSTVKDNILFNQTVGISVSDSSSNFIINNTIFNVDYGIQIKNLNPETWSTENNKISKNTLTDINKVPVLISESSARNTIFHNTFDVSNVTAIVLKPNVGPGNIFSTNYFTEESKIKSPKKEIVENKLDSFRIGLVDNSFTRTANQPDSFSSFFLKYENQNQNIIYSDQHLLTSNIIEDTNQNVLQFKDHLETVSPSSEVSILRDEEIHKKMIFDEKGYRLFDILILFNEEFVTQEAYNNFKSFVSKGGKIIFLDGGVFVAEVLYDELDNSIQFKKGKNWEFDGTKIESSDWERYFSKNQEWIGSNTLLENDIQSLFLLNIPFSYEQKGESFVSNSEARIWHDFGAISLENLGDKKTSDSKIAIYEMDFGKGQVIMMGISSSSILENDVFVNFFDNFILPKVLGDEYDLEQFEKNQDLTIQWLLDSGKISSTDVDLKLKAITFNLDRTHEIEDSLNLIIPQNLLLISKTDSAISKTFVDGIAVDSNPILTDIGTGFKIPLQKNSTRVQIIGEEIGYFDSIPPKILLNKINFNFDTGTQKIIVEGSAIDGDSGITKVDLFLEKIPSGEILTFKNDEADPIDWSSWKMETSFDGDVNYKIIATTSDLLKNRAWTESEVFEGFNLKDEQYIKNQIKNSNVENTFDVIWKSTYANVTDIKLDKEEKSLILNLENKTPDKIDHDQNTLLVTIPNSLMYSSTETPVAEFIVFVDGIRVDYNQTSDDFGRTLGFPLLSDSEEIRIFGINILDEHEPTLPSISKEINQIDESSSKGNLQQKIKLECLSNDISCVIMDYLLNFSLF